MGTHDDLKQIVADWKSGKGMRVLALGHSKTVRQQLVYECAFLTLAEFAEGTAPTPETFEGVKILSEQMALGLELTSEERGAATSLAWLVLRNGWAQAMSGHADHKYLMLTREARAA